jgi:transcriptional regulator with XRE-family HTH domain
MDGGVALNMRCTSRTGIPALPFCHVVLRQELKPARYPNILNHLGDHLKKRRLDLGLNQKQAAKLLGCHATSVANWASGATVPALAQWPKIIEFLGYDPRPNVETVVDQLKRYREGRGWSQVEVAEKLGVSSSIVWKWETGRRHPNGKYLAKVYWLLGDDPRPEPRTYGERLKRHRERWD